MNFGDTALHGGQLPTNDISHRLVGRVLHPTHGVAHHAAGHPWHSLVGQGRGVVGVWWEPTTPGKQAGPPRSILQQRWPTPRLPDSEQV